MPGQGISIAGQRNLYNSFIVDGVSANDDAADLTGTYYSEEVIDQFQVVTSGGIAEFGRASGGVVNILTQVGNKRLARQSVRILPQPAFRRSQSTRADKRSADSGAIRRRLSVVHCGSERTFFFSNFEQTRRNYSAGHNYLASGSDTQLTIACARSTIRVHSSKPASCLQVSTRPTSSRASITRINQRNQLSARYSLYHINAVNSRTVGGLNAISRGTGLADTDQTVQVSNVTTFSSRTINEARVPVHQQPARCPG